MTPRIDSQPGRIKILPWEEKSWKDEAAGWVSQVLRTKGIQPGSELIEIQRRPWSVIMKTATDEGDFYFKACSPVLQHEPGLTQALAEWQPGKVLSPLDFDKFRGWMLLPDGGRTLRSYFQEGMDWSAWLEILPNYGEMQRALASRSTDLLQLGILDRRLNSLPGRFEQLMNDLPALRVGKKDGLSGAEYQNLMDELPIFNRLSRELAEYDIPETLQHDDFHDGNIFYSDRKPVFFDWGETCLSHPFFSMVVGMNSIAYRFDMQPVDHRREKLRDAYLEPWTSHHPRRSLEKAYDLAMQVGAVNRALTWHRVVSSLPYRWKRENTDAVPGWLQEYLQRRSSSSGV